MSNPFPPGTPMHELASIINRLAKQVVEPKQQEKKEPVKEQAA
jgi:hypothetical protein